MFFSYFAFRDTQILHFREDPRNRARFADNLKMNNLHETFGGAHLDFEIDYLQARMIQSIVSFKVGSVLEYDELTVIELNDQSCTVMVNASGQIVEFCQP